MLTARTRQWLQAIILLLMGLYFLDNMLSGHIYYYINERFGWLSWLATGIFLALGGVGIANVLRQQREERAHALEDHEHDHGDDHDDHDHAEHDHGHDHVHGAVSWPVLSLIALPLIIGLIIPSKPLGAAAVGSSGVNMTYTGLNGSTNSTQLTTAPTDRNVLDWVKAFNTTTNVDEFTGQSADLVGFVYRDIRFDNKPLFMVARFTISCCVADAVAIGVTIQSDQAAKLAPDSWVHVKGKFQTQVLDGQKTPVVVADSIEPTTQPDQPYLYP